jgi:hypothetical protein
LLNFDRVATDHHEPQERAMVIRSYQAGDEHAQARIYNAAAGSLPGFKPATAEEIARRFQSGDPGPESRYYAVENGEVMGYAVFGSNGRVSYPWCLPQAEILREPLLETIMADMKKRRLRQAWVAYRADWTPVLDFLRQHGFTQKRAMINYIAKVSELSSPDRLPPNRVVAHLERAELPQLLALAPALFSDLDAPALDRFFWDHPSYNFPERLFALKDAEGGTTVGVFLFVSNARFADPTKIDAAMPCFRLGAFGTERERHKRVNGLFSCIFADESEGEALNNVLAAQARRSGLTHVAAQAPSDAPALCAWYDRTFERQGAFPILSRPV